MRIFQIVNTISVTGGIERYVQRLSCRVSAQGHSTIIAELQAPTVNEPSNELYTVLRPSSLDELCGLIAKWQPDVVLSHHAGDGTMLDRLRSEGYLVADLIHTTMCPGGEAFPMGRPGLQTCHEREVHTGLVCGAMRNNIIAARCTPYYQYSAITCSGFGES